MFEINKTIFAEFLKENTNSSVDVNKIVDDEYLSSSNIKILGRANPPQYKHLGNADVNSHASI